MFIDISKINKDDFNISPRTHKVLGEVILITPKKGKHKWNNDELHLRSLLIKPDGKILSSGFFKFHNIGERPDDDVAMFEAMQQGVPFYFPEKMDGSLIIRTVIGDYISFRTRGSHHLGDFEPAVMSLIKEKYPRLLDINLYPDMTMLFEYTSPDNQIVVKYDDSKLTLLGVMIYTEELPKFVGTPSLIEDMARASGVSALKFHEFDQKAGLDKVYNEISSWENKEGIVIWCNDSNGMRLAKLKSPEYVRLHALKFQLSEDKVRKVAFVKDLLTLSDLQNYFFNLDIDWESVSFIEEFFNKYIEEKNVEEKIVQDFVTRMNVHPELFLDISRKRKALIVKELSNNDKSLFSLGMKYIFGNPTDRKIMIIRTVGCRVLGVPMNTLVYIKKFVEEDFGVLNAARK